MKKTSQLIASLLMILVLVPGTVMGQYQSEVPSIPGMTLGQESSATHFFGLDLSRIDFQHSYSMEVGSFGGNTVSMGLLKSSFNYIINPQVSVKGYVGLMHSPFSSVAPMESQFTPYSGLNSNNLVYGGEITYRPKENVLFQIGIQKMPVSPFQNPYSIYPYSHRGY